MEKVIECDCGWTFRGSEDDLVAATLKHAREAHHLDLTREQVLAASKPTTPESAQRAARRSDRDR
jgi:predicted small metal-binding protein